MPCRGGRPGHGRTAGVEQVDQVEVVEVEGEGCDQQWSDRNQQQGQGDIPELLPAVGAIHLGGFVVIFGDGLQCAAADQHKVRVTQPQIDEQDGDLCPPCIGEPGW